MRWFWIDRFVTFESGRRAVAVKTVTMAEEAVENYFPGHPTLPASLIVEGLAQTGGLLVAQHNDFSERVVLAKVSHARFHFLAQPGDSLRFEAVVEDIKADGAIVHGTSHIDDRLQAEVELVFAHLDERFRGVDLFYPADFVRMLRMLKLFDVGVRPDGQPIAIPAHMLEAEELALGREST